MTQLIRIIAAGGALAACTLTASARIDRVVEKSFQVEPGVHLSVSTSGGEIRVDPSSDGSVRVVAKERIHASSESEADDVLKNLELVIEQHGSEVVATAKYRGMPGFHLFSSWPPVEVDFVVTVPTRTSVDLKTSGGDIVVGDLDGGVLAHTSGGDIGIGKIHGDVNASTSGGTVKLADSSGTVKLETSGGDVYVGRVVGPADLQTSGGNIKIDSVENTLSAHTSGGNVRAGFAGSLKGDCVLSTSGGNVEATVGRNVAFHLDASTSGGDVGADGLTITIDHGGIGKSSLSGDVNGGGPLLQMHTSGGNVRIERG